MKEARHIGTGKIVRASEADYEDFYGIYECPDCKAALLLRNSHIRDGKAISAAFYHPPGVTEEQKNCQYRISMNFGDEILGTEKIDGTVKVLGLKESLLEEVEKVLLDQKLTNSFFQWMYQNELVDSNVVNFEQVKLFHNHIFDYIINYLVDFNWYCLLS